MATTKIHAIKSTLSKAIAYIENPEKTQGQLLVSGYNTEPQMAALDFEMTATLARKIRYAQSKRTNNLAYHLIQSFAPDDAVTPEQAHALGRKLASEFTEGKFEFVVSTHVDKDHIHNHIIINAVSFYDYKRLRTVPYRTARTIRAISDRLCAELGLSIIETPKESGISYEEYMKKKKRVPARSILRKRLNFVLARATSYEEFKHMAEELGVAVNDEHMHITYTLRESNGKAIRGKSLGDTDKYLRDGIFEQLAVNVENQALLKASIEKAVHSADSYESFIARMAEVGITVKTNRKGMVSYKLPDGESTLSETVLGEEYATDVIQQIVHGTLTAFPAHQSRDIRACFEQQAKHMPDEPDTFVALRAEQVIKTSADGILLAVMDSAGKPAHLMLDKDHVVFNGNQILAALGTRFEYTFHGENGLDSARGEALIRNIELANNVSPRILRLSAAQIKTISLKGVTLSLPDAGIERLFIPAEYVHLDSENGICSISIYDNWTYTFTPVPQETAQPVRQSIKGAPLYDAIASEQQHTPVDDLRKRINYIERQSKFAETEFLADMLLTMSPTRSPRGIALHLKECQKERALLEAQIKSTADKCTQYRFAARCLQTVQSYKCLAQTLLGLPMGRQRMFREKHKLQLAAYEKAVQDLERIDVSIDVMPEKVVELIHNREQQIADLQKQIDNLKQRELTLGKMQLYAETIREEHTKENERDNRR